MKKLSVSLVTGSLFAASTALAQPTPKFEYGKAEEVKDVKAVEWKATAEAGLVLTSGNAETTTATAGAKISRKAAANKLELALGFAYAQSGIRIAIDRNANGTIGANEIENSTSTTAETYEGKLRYDRFLTEFNSLFAALVGKRDIPAGKELVVGGQLGYSRRLYKSEKHEAVGEFGYDFSYEKPVTATDALNIHSARIFVGYKGAVSDTTSVDGSIEALINLNTLQTPTGEAGLAEDTRINATAGVTSKVGSDLSLNLGLTMRYDATPSPLSIAGATFDAGFVPELSSLDTIIKASLIYSFF